MFTKEEIEDNYEFKVVKRILKKEFPFIKDIRLTDTWAKYKSLLFIDILLDHNELLEYLGQEPTPSFKSWINMFRNGVPYLILLFSPDIKKNKEQEIDDLSRKITKTVNRVQQSPSIPLDMKLPMPLSVSEWAPLNVTE